MTYVVGRGAAKAPAKQARRGRMTVLGACAIGCAAFWALAALGLAQVLN